MNPLLTVQSPRRVAILSIHTTSSVNFINTQTYVSKRRELSLDPNVHSSIVRFWRLLRKNENHTISRHEYIHFYKRVFKCLLPFSVYNGEEIEQQALNEWETDKSEDNAMNFESFYDFVFEIVDYWVLGVTSYAYNQFLKVLYHAITIRIEEEEPPSNTPRTRVTWSSTLSQNANKNTKPAVSEKDHDDSDDSDNELDENSDGYDEVLFLGVKERWAEEHEILHENYFYEQAMINDGSLTNNTEITITVSNNIQNSGTNNDNNSSNGGNNNVDLKLTNKSGSKWLFTEKQPLRYLSPSKKEIDEELSRFYEHPTSVCVTGKPRSGKSTLSSYISSIFGLINLDLTSLIEQEIESNTQVGREIKKFLSKGGLITDIEALKIFEYFVNSEEIGYKGYVLDGFPFNETHLSEILTWKYPPQYFLILDIEDEQNLPRLSDGKFDFENGRVVRQHQIEALKNNTNIVNHLNLGRNITNSHSTQSLDQVESTFLEEFNYGEKNGGIDSESFGEDENAWLLELSEEKKKEILNSLIDLPELHSSTAMRNLQKFSNNLKLMEEKIVHVLNIPTHHIHHIPTSSGIYGMCFIAKNKLEGIQMYYPTLLLPPSSVHLDPIHKRSHLENVDINKLPSRVWSTFSTYCPVTYYFEGKLIQGAWNLAVAYCNHIYMFANEHCLSLFEENPKKFLRNPAPPPRHKGIIVIGPPLSGKTTHAKLIAHSLGIPCIDIEDLLNYYVASDSPDTEIGLVAKKKLKEGGNIPSDVYARMILLETEKLHEKSRGKSLNASGKVPSEYGCPIGWVLDGFPLTAEQATVMLRAGVTPSVVIILKDESPGRTFLNSRARGSGYGYDPTINRENTEGYGFAYNSTSILDRTHGVIHNIGSRLETLIDHLDTVKAVFRRKRDDVVVEVQEVSCNTPIPTTHGRIMQILDPLHLLASEVEQELDNLTKMDSMWGLTKQFCPVTLYRHGSIIPGHRRRAVRWLGRIYTLVGDDEYIDFLSNPQFYLRGKNSNANTSIQTQTFSPITPPPPRFWVVGPCGAGCTTIAKYIATTQGVGYINMESVLDEIANDIRHALNSEIKSYLDIEEKVPDELQVSALLSLLERAPYTTKGYVLDAFPLSASQWMLLDHQKIYPDVILFLEVDDEKALERKFKPFTKEDVEKEIQRRKQEEEEYGDEEMELNLNPVDVEKEMRERQEDSILDLYEDQVQNLGQLHTALSMSNVIVSIVDTDKTLKKVIASLPPIIKPIMENREAMFEDALKIDSEDSSTLLSLGIKTLGKFGKYCPVNFFYKKELSFPQTQINKDFPVIYGDEIFFCLDEKYADEFVSNPKKYLNFTTAPPLNITTVTPRVIVIGLPKSGKSSFTRKLAHKLGAVRLTFGRILKWALSTLGPNSNENTTKTPHPLYTQIETILRDGFQIPDNIYFSLLQMILETFQCQTRGWVLEAFPLTVAQAMGMTLDLNIIPSHVFSLEISELEIYQRLEKNRKVRLGKKQKNTLDNDSDNENEYNDNKAKDSQKNDKVMDNPLLPLHNSDAIMKIRLESQLEHHFSLKKFFQETYGNLVTLDGTKSKWHLYHHAEKLVRKNLYQGMVYYTNVGQGKAASIGFQRLTMDEISNKLSHCEYYCPVSLFRGELFYSESMHEYKEDQISYFETPSITISSAINTPNTVTSPPLLNHAAEYKGKIYFTKGDDELNEFLNNPEVYVNQKLPLHLPKIYTHISTKPLNLEFGGYCPVTFKHGRTKKNTHFEHLTKGNNQHIVEYQGKYYSFVNQEQLTLFMRTPHIFSNLTLPSKLPPSSKPLSIQSLPLLGYIEQTVSSIIIDAIKEVAKFRPKYPYLTSIQSATKFMSLYFKAHNPNSNPYLREIYAKKLDKFKQDCKIVPNLSKELNELGDKDQWLDLLSTQNLETELFNNIVNEFDTIKTYNVSWFNSHHTESEGDHAIQKVDR